MVKDLRVEAVVVRPIGGSGEVGTPEPGVLTFDSGCLRWGATPSTTREQASGRAGNTCWVAYSFGALGEVALPDGSCRAIKILESRLVAMYQKPGRIQDGTRAEFGAPALCYALNSRGGLWRASTCFRARRGVMGSALQPFVAGATKGCTFRG